VSEKLDTKSGQGRFNIFSSAYLSEILQLKSPNSSFR